MILISQRFLAVSYLLFSLTSWTLEELLRFCLCGRVGGDGDVEDQRGGDGREPPLSYPRLHLKSKEEGDDLEAFKARTRVCQQLCIQPGLK